MALSASRTGRSRRTDNLSEVDRLVLSHVNAPYRRDISVSTLRRSLAKSDLGDWSVHLATFFTDLPADLVLRFATSHRISRSRLAETYRVVKVKTGERNPDLEAALVAVAPAAR